MENRTADQLLQDYTAMGHSVALITDVIAGNSMAEEDAPTRQSCVDRNVQYLELMRAKDDWGSEDFAATDSAISAGNSYAAA